MKIIERNLQQIGQSFLISLPKDWTKVFKLHKGSKMKLIISEQGNLSIAPEFIQEQKRSEIAIPFDRYFKGRFFRAYFQGNEKITFLWRKENKQIERKELYEFLKLFMNVQIIEESTNKIVIKCFHIDELSIEECLKRMYFLSLTLFEEIGSGRDKDKVKEIRYTMIRFYYLLIMQIRRYLAEGKFIENNQISLLKAMDYRMVAEKIHRLGEILIQTTRGVNKSELEKVKNYYNKVFNCYLNDNFENSASLLFEMGKLEKEIQENNLAIILRYVKEICRLTR